MNAIKKSLYWAILAFVFVMPLSSDACVKILIVAFVLSFFVKDPPTIRTFNLAWDIIPFVLVLCAGLLYSANVEDGYRVLETSFSLIAVPFVINKTRHLYVNILVNVFNAFSLGLIAACSYALVVAFNNYSATGDLHSFFFYQLTDPIHSHPTYLAYYLIFDITLGLYILYYGGDNRVPRILIAIVTIFAFGMLMLTGGRTAFVSLLLICSFFVLKRIVEKGSLWKNIVFAMVIFIIGFTLLGNSIEQWQSQLAESDYWERWSLWTAGIDANTDVIFGVGTGDYKDVLNKYYLTHDLEEFAAGNFNAHNQFIQMYLSNGLIGLLCLALLIARPLYLAVQSKYTIGILIFFPFIIYGMNEVFLGRFQGLVFFIFLHQLVTSHGIDNRPSELLKVG